MRSGSILYATVFNFPQKSKIFSKFQFVLKNWNFFQKSKIFSKFENIHQNRKTFWKLYIFVNFNFEILIGTWKFIFQIVVKNRNYRQKLIFFCKKPKPLPKKHFFQKPKILSKTQKSKPIFKILNIFNSSTTLCCKFQSGVW